MNQNEWRNPSPDWLYWLVIAFWGCLAVIAVLVIWLVIMPVLTFVLAFVVMLFAGWLVIRWVGSRIEDWFK